VSQPRSGDLQRRGDLRVHRAEVAVAPFLECHDDRLLADERSSGDHLGARLRGATRLTARGGAPSGLSHLARRGNAVIIEKASHDACLFTGSIEQRRITPACKRSSCPTESASKASDSGAIERGRCSQRSRISAARGLVRARSRRPRSMSASLGGSRSCRPARDVPQLRHDGFGGRGYPRASRSPGFRVFRGRRA
jgi:hypothetical protein